jgi:O-methyltransferase
VGDLMKVIIFGAGQTGMRCCQQSENDIEILALADNDPKKIGRTLFGHIVVSPERIASFNYDKIIVAINDLTQEGCVAVSEALKQLYDMGLPQQKIGLYDCRYSRADSRVDFLRRLSVELQANLISGAVAECGVYRGHFAGYISEYFPGRKFYLFDTFKGFDERDVLLEDHNGNKESLDWCKGGSIPWLSRGNADIALLRCLHRENVEIKNGYVPETFVGLENERFAFVNLDMDLYAPTLAALRFFFKRLTSGGVILIHDYYHEFFFGIKQAVDKFAEECAFTRLPIGDACSIAIVPYC